MTTDLERCARGVEHILAISNNGLFFKTITNSEELHVVN